MSEDFRLGKRAAVMKSAPTEERITICLDADVVALFKRLVHAAGGGNYQTLINEALREYMRVHDQSLGDTLRKVIRGELKKAL